MGVAEGIETALAVTRDFGIPCWSTISADGLKAFTPPAIVKRLRIFGDNDPKYGGQAAAYALAHRMSVRLDCVECSVEIPNQTGTDWADRRDARSEEHTSELQSLMRISYAVFCLKKKKKESRTKSNMRST